jgi:hypothetical protein
MGVVGMHTADETKQKKNKRRRAEVGVVAIKVVGIDSFLPSWNWLKGGSELAVWRRRQGLHSSTYIFLSFSNYSALR